MNFANLLYIIMLKPIIKKSGYCLSKYIYICIFLILASPPTSTLQATTTTRSGKLYTEACYKKQSIICKINNIYVAY